MPPVQGGNPPKSLLLVDDSRDYCTHVERAFRLVQPGTAVFPLSDGQRAIEHFVLCGTERPIPDLVLLDRFMPGGPDGYEVLRAIRQLEPLLKLPVLMISGSDDPEHVDEARKAGATGYITKPSVQADYPQLARQVLEWWEAKESWAQLGPSVGQRCLELPGGAVGSRPTMALQTQVAQFFNPTGGDQSIFQRFLGFLDYCKQAAVEAQDPFLLSFSQACRRHRLTPTQAMQSGGSHRLLANRRAVQVDLIAEGWPDETLAEMFHLSRTELKRLHAQARTKVGPKLDLLRS